jgi:hypothetical protein
VFASTDPAYLELDWKTSTLGRMKCAASVVLLTLMLCVCAVAQSNIDFSGTYSLVSIKSANAPKKVPESTLAIVQHDGIVEVTRVADGRSLVSRYTLDGKECRNVTSGGVPSTDKAELKGKNVIIRSTVPLNASQPAASSVVTTERWELSKDSMLLTIHSKSEFSGMAVLDFSATEVYSRIANDSNVSSH